MVEKTLSNRRKWAFENGIILKNFVKCQALYLLSIASYLGPARATLGWISKHVDSTPNSLSVLLARWVGWDLVRRDRVPLMDENGASRVQYFYILAPRGFSYLKSMPEWYEQYNEATSRVIEKLRMRQAVYFTTGPADKLTWHIVLPPLQNIKETWSYKRSTTRPRAGLGVENIESVYKCVKLTRGIEVSGQFKAWLCERVEGVAT